MTSEGGAFPVGAGNVFSISTNGIDFRTLLSFNSIDKAQIRSAICC